QAFGRFALALFCTCNRLGDPGGHHVPVRTDLLRDSRSLRRTRNRIAYGSAAYLGPRLEREGLEEEVHPPVRTSAGGRCAQEGKRQILGPDRISRDAEPGG